ncbi:unnamed protein product [Sympodiomycopsis kandeliae]
MDSDLQTYKTQLAQVNEALEADPSNTELQTLRDELNNLITLTESLVKDQARSSSSSNGAKTQNDSSTAAPQPPRALKAGDDCTAKYSGDGRWYPARVTAVSGSAQDPVYSVLFTGYNNSEMVRSHDIRANASMPSASRSVPAASTATSSTTSTSATSADASSSSKKRSTVSTPTLTPEEEAERERKRKRNEKKSESRETKAQEASNKANSWQKFAKKGAKKGYGIAGEKSMFKTPDDPYAKVGVVGAGRGMTKSQGRSKHTYES